MKIVSRRSRVQLPPEPEEVPSNPSRVPDVPSVDGQPDADEADGGYYHEHWVIQGAIKLGYTLIHVQTTQVWVFCLHGKPYHVATELQLRFNPSAVMQQLHDIMAEGGST